MSGYVPQSFKIAIIKPSLKMSKLDPDNLANDSPISYIEKYIPTGWTVQVLFRPEGIYFTIMTAGLYIIRLLAKTIEDILFNDFIVVSWFPAFPIGQRFSIPHRSVMRKQPVHGALRPPQSMLGASVTHQVPAPLDWTSGFVAFYSCFPELLFSHGVFKAKLNSFVCPLP